MLSSRIARIPLTIPESVQVELTKQLLRIESGKQALELQMHPAVKIDHKDGMLHFASTGGRSRTAKSLPGTFRSLVNNMLIGVTKGFQKKLQLQGVGYRAKLAGNTLSLSLGFSHPVDCIIPEGLSLQLPSQTEILVSGADKQRVGQFAATIRAYRPPEPYKGKGVRYADERVFRKETKKK